jgi:hypothetical protein
MKKLLALMSAATLLFGVTSLSLAQDKSDSKMGGAPKMGKMDKSKGKSTGKSKGKMGKMGKSKGKSSGKMGKMGKMDKAKGGDKKM